MKSQLLIADDDESVRKMVGRVLESAGYAVTSVANGREAVRRLTNQPPDLILLDLQTPKPDSWRVVEQVRRHYPWVPVVLITALCNQQDQARRRGVEALMEKPLDMPLLLKTIESLLARKAPIGHDVTA
jgi:two-component system response regulator GlrR